MLEDKTKLHKELLAASDYIVNLEERCYKANQNSLYLIHELDLYQPQVDTLKAYIIDLKSRIPNFVHTKGDPVDTALAEYINNLPHRRQMKLMFLRLQ